MHNRKDWQAGTWWETRRSSTGAKSSEKLRGSEKPSVFTGTMTLGHPAVKYRNKVTGKTLPVQWNGV